MHCTESCAGARTTAECAGMSTATCATRSRTDVSQLEVVVVRLKLPRTCRSWTASGFSLYLQRPDPLTQECPLPAKSTPTRGHAIRNHAPAGASGRGDPCSGPSAKHEPLIILPLLCSPNEGLREAGPPPEPPQSFVHCTGIRVSSDFLKTSSRSNNSKSGLMF